MTKSDITQEEFYDIFSNKKKANKSDFNSFLKKYTFSNDGDTVSLKNTFEELKNHKNDVTEINLNFHQLSAEFQQYVNERIQQVYAQFKMGKNNRDGRKANRINNIQLKKFSNQFDEGFAASGRWYITNIATIKSAFKNSLQKNSFEYSIGNYYHVAGLDPSAIFQLKEIQLPVFHKFTTYSLVASVEQEYANNSRYDNMSLTLDVIVNAEGVEGDIRDYVKLYDRYARAKSFHDHLNYDTAISSSIQNKIDMSYLAGNCKLDFCATFSPEKVKQKNRNIKTLYLFYYDALSQKMNFSLKDFDFVKVLSERQKLIELITKYDAVINSVADKCKK